MLGAHYQVEESAWVPGRSISLSWCAPSCAQLNEKHRLAVSSCSDEEEPHNCRGDMQLFIYLLIYNRLCLFLK
jgi:hypothetical protein